MPETPIETPYGTGLAASHGEHGSPYLATGSGAQTLTEPAVNEPRAIGWNLDQAHLLNLLSLSCTALDLDLSGLVVLTGASDFHEELVASAAAFAGARVIAVSRESKRHTRRPDGRQVSMVKLAEYPDLANRIQIASRVDRRCWEDVDILVNSPLIEQMLGSIVELVPQTAVVALMAEPWELRPARVHVEECRRMGVKIAAPNLDHPQIDLLPQLAQLCCKSISEAGVTPRGARIALLCDTPFGPLVERGLVERGAKVRVFPHPMLLNRESWDAVVVALRPSDRPSLDLKGVATVAENARGAKLVQFSGEVDRVAARYFGLHMWPPRKRPMSQFGIGADALAPAAMIRKIVGALKAAETVRRGSTLGAGIEHIV